MVVYADVLIFLNTIINFLMVSLTAKICRSTPKTLRLILGSFIGALFSLYIFLPNQSLLLELSVRLVCSALIVTVCFTIKHIKQFFKILLIFYLISFTFAGLMLGIWLLFKPNGLIVHNSVVYYNISPVLLIILSSAAYLLITLIQQIFKNRASSDNICRIELKLNENLITSNALIDSGHTVTDIFSSGDVIFISEKKAELLFGINSAADFENLNSALKNRYRVIPYSTVDGSGLLNAFVCDSATVYKKDKTTVLNKPTVAIAKTNFNDDYSAVISPRALENS